MSFSQCYCVAGHMNLCTYHILSFFQTICNRTKELTYLGFAKEFATITNPLPNDNITI
jgi:hypothetical protein